MIWENDKQSASRYLSKFAQLIRTTLEHSRQTFITVKQCVQHLEQYMEMEKIRFEDFAYSIETDKTLELDEIRMAPMLVQPLVENAIWHGLKNSNENKTIEIKFYKDRQYVVCEIADNGPGINHKPKVTKVGEPHRSISISNIHSRLKMLNEKYNMHCSLEFIDKADKDPQAHGTIAILRLSL
jgi:LytS/YehU family sensor histidine kinase